MQGLNATKPGCNRAPSETVLGSTQLEQPQMQGNSHITDTACQSKMDAHTNQNTIAETRRQVASTLAALNLEERRAALSNLYQFDNGDSLEVERQKLAAAMRGRFRIAEWIDDICSMWGWRFTGFSWVDLTGRWEDDLERGPDLEWMHPSDDDHTVRLVVGDEPQLFLSEDSGNTWRNIRIDQLGDSLGDWREGLDVRRAA